MPRADVLRILTTNGWMPPAQGYAGARAALARALELDPGNQALVNRYANRRWMFHGESAEAIAILEPLIASDPSRCLRKNPQNVPTAPPVLMPPRNGISSTRATRNPSRAPTTAAAFRVIMLSEYQKFGRLVKQSGARMD